MEEKEIVDGQMLDTKKEKNIKSKCPNCGSELKFLPGTNKLKCISCDAEFEIESLGKGKLDDEELDYFESLEKIKNSSKKEVTRYVRCEDCGAMITLNSRTISTICPFCGSHRTIQEDKEEQLIPMAGVIPFVIEEKQVKDLFNKWIKKKFFAPIKIKNKTLSPTYLPFYIPFYTFDTDTFSTYTARRGDYYYVTVGTGKNRHTERRIRWRNVSGSLTKNYDDLTIRATSNVLNKYIEQIKDYNFNQMEKYNEKFLLGYYGEKPAVTLEDGFANARQIIHNDLCRMARSEIGGDVVEDLRVKTRYEDITFKQIMAPIYNGTYEYNKKNYCFLVNGQTGKFAGKSPLSPLKVTIFALLIAAIVVGLIILFLNYMKG